MDGRQPMNLTEDDKTWLAELLQANQKSLLAAVESRFSEGLQGVEARFSERLQGVEARFSERLKGVEIRFSESLQDVETKFSEQLHDVETKLLTEFHKWASPSEARQRTHTAALRAIDEEMEYLSDRVKKLESQA
jgi:hypothetical protein